MAIEQLIVTDCQAGKGVDPRCTGYQIKACSPALTAEHRFRLFRIAEHYGQALGARRTAAGRAKQDAWDAQRKGRDPIPPDVMNEYPVIWSYDRLSDSRMAMTCVRFAGWALDGRWGNFFAHSFAFSPEDLGDAHRWNPMALSHSALFLSSHADTDTVIPELTSFGSAAANPDHGILNKPSYSAHADAIVSMLSTADPAIRPVLLCLTDWKDAPELVEALLDLLPPVTRLNTTFCTFENDRDWAPPLMSGQRPSGVRAHHLIVCYGEEGLPLYLRPDEYQAKFSVFNLVDNKVSELPPTRPYATFAVSCLKENQVTRLAQHHDLVDRLLRADDLAAWDVLVPAAGLQSGAFLGKDVEAAAEAMVAVSDTPERAGCAMGLLAPYLRSLAQGGNAAALLGLAPSTARLVAVMGVNLKDPDMTPLTPWGDLTLEAVRNGRGGVADALLKTVGARRSELLLKAIRQLLTQPWTAPPATDKNDREAILALVTEAITMVAPDYKDPLLAPLVAVAFHTARDAGVLRAAWNAHAGLVTTLLGDPWDSGKEKLLRELEGFVQPDQCPEGSAQLNLLLLKHAPLSDEEFLQRLKTVSATASATSTDEILAMARSRFQSQSQSLASAMGELADAAAQSACGRPLWEEYRQATLDRLNTLRSLLGEAETALDQARKPADRPEPAAKPGFDFRRLTTWMPGREGKQASKTPATAAPDAAKAVKEARDQLTQFEASVREVRNRLVRVGAFRVLCSDLLAEVIPWDEKRWGLWESIWKSNPRFQDAARESVAIRLANTGSSAEMGPLLDEIFPEQRLWTEPGSHRLLEAVALSLPMAPLHKPWGQRFSSIPQGLSEQASARLGILKAISDVEDRSKRVCWTPAGFPFDNSAWQNLKSLNAQDAEAALLWCVHGFAGGIETVQEAQGLVRLLELAPSPRPLPDRVGDAVTTLIENRDAVSAVLVAKAFAACAAASDRDHKARWDEIRDAVLKRIDSETRRLYEDHVSRGFRRSANASPTSSEKGS